MHTDSVIQLPHKQKSSSSKRGSKRGRRGEEAFNSCRLGWMGAGSKASACRASALALHFKCQKAAKYLNWNWNRSRSLHLVLPQEGSSGRSEERESLPGGGSKALPLIQMRHFCLAALWRLHIQAGAAPTPAPYPPAAAAATSLVIMSGVDYALCSMQRHKDCSTEEQTSDNCSVH